MRATSGLFPALLKFWRGRRGLSQLDLALAAGVSARHVSFLETGRAQPSREMVLRLGAALAVPLRDQDAMLRAGGFQPVFEDRGIEAGLPPAIAQALERMMAQQEPYPLVVMNRRYDVLRANAATFRLIPRLVADPSALTLPLNVIHMVCDPRLLRPAILEWEGVAGAILRRIHHEALQRPGDEVLGQLLGSVLALPGMPAAWRQPDLSQTTDPAFSVRVRKGELTLGFLTTITGFNGPQQVTLDELRIESYFPLDEVTARVCAALAAEDQR
jgi:transcriptional regulator with XRE-family HTH domain